MNGWEGQVLAIAVKELIEAAKTLGRDGFGIGKDKTLLSAVIRDLLSQNPNVARAQATLKQVESLGTQPADYYVAKQLLAKVQRLPPLPAGEGRGEGSPHGGSPSRVTARNASRSSRGEKPTRRSHSLLDRHDALLPDHRADLAVRLSAHDRPHARPRDNS